MDSATTYTFEIDESSIVDTDRPLIETGFDSLLFYDGPILYTGFNKSGERVVGSVADVDNEHGFYRQFAVIVPEAAFRKYVSSEITYRQLLADHPPLYVLDHLHLHTERRVYGITLDGVPEDWRPTEDSYLHLDPSEVDQVLSDPA